MSDIARTLCNVFIELTSLFAHQIGYCDNQITVSTALVIYSCGPNNSVVLNKRGGWTIHPKLINVWSEISMWSDFSMIYLKEFCTKTKDYCLKF